LLLGTGSAAEAQSTSLEQEVTKLNQSVQELVALLREYLAHQEVDLRLKRVELGLQKLVPLNQELTTLRAKKSADEELLGQLRSARTALEARESQDGDGTGADPQAAQAATDDAVRKVQLEEEAKRLKRRISEAEQRIAELENVLAQEQRNLQLWEAEVDRRLGVR
jgi:chromosome segregation ATPase